MDKKKFAFSVLYKYSKHKSMSHKTIFYKLALQPLSTIFKIILTAFCALICMSIGIFVTANQPTNTALPFSIEWSLICSRFKKFD